MHKIFRSKSLMLVLLIVAGVQGIKAQQGVSVRQVLSPTLFNAMMAEEKDAIVLDVRTTEELRKGFIAGSVNIDYKSDDFRKKISTLDKSKTYLVYCASGIRSSKAVDVMEELGFKTLYELEGGFIAWGENGLPIKRKR